MEAHQAWIISYYISTLTWIPQSSKYVWRSMIPSHQSFLFLIQQVWTIPSPQHSLSSQLGCKYPGYHKRIHRESSDKPEHVPTRLCSRCSRSLTFWLVFRVASCLYSSPRAQVPCSLTNAEEAATARIAIVMNCQKLKGVIRSLSGYVSFLYQDQSQMFDQLPRLPTQTSLVVFKARNVNCEPQQGVQG